MVPDLDEKYLFIWFLYHCFALRFLYIINIKIPKSYHVTIVNKNPEHVYLCTYYWNSKIKTRNYLQRITGKIYIKLIYHTHFLLPPSNISKKHENFTFFLTLSQMRYMVISPLYGFFFKSYFFTLQEPCYSTKGTKA